MKKLLIIFLILFSYSTVNAEITDKDERFTLLCEAEQSVGYRWENNDWTEMSWRLHRYVITKQDYEPIQNTLGAEHRNCAFNRAKYYHNTFTSQIFMDSCYMIKEFGEEVKEDSYRTCREEWDANTNALKKVTCKTVPVGEFILESILFKPNGWFTKYRIAGEVANIPKALMVDDYVISPAGVKDDMFIFVGRCSTL